MAQCTAKSKRSGKQCNLGAVPGATVCRIHGGSAPQVRRAAAARAARLEAHAEAERMVARAGVDADPIEHLLESLHRAAALVEVWGRMVSDLDAHAAQRVAAAGTVRGDLGYYEAGEDSHDELGVVASDPLMALNYRGEAQVHPYVTEYQQALERRAKFAKLCIDAGIAERQVRIAEEQARLLAQTLTAIFEDLGIERTPQVTETIGRHLRLAYSAA